MNNKNKNNPATSMRSAINIINEAVQPYEFRDSNTAMFSVPRVVNDTIEVKFTPNNIYNDVIQIDFGSLLFGTGDAKSDRRSAMDIFQTVEALVMDYYNTNKGNFIGFSYLSVDNSKDKRLRIYDKIAERLRKSIRKDTTSFFFDLDDGGTYILFSEALKKQPGMYEAMVEEWGEPT